MSNPLLANPTLPEFNTIDASHIAPAIENLIAECIKHSDKAAENLSPTWDNLVKPLEEANDKLSKAWSPVGHLNGVKNTPDLREAYADAIAKLTAYHTQIGQHTGLYQAYKTLAASDEFATLTQEQQQALNHTLRDFDLAGVGLEDDAKQRYGEIQSRLSELNTTFSNNVLDATQAWSKHFDTQEGLEGLPESSIALAHQLAQAKEKDGYLLTLDIPCYLAVMTYADDSALREAMYIAYSTRASDQGPNAGEWNNSDVIDEILSLRHEAAELLGFDNYAELSLATKMADNCDDVEAFLLELADKSRSQAQADVEELRQFAKTQDGTETLNAWDMAYYSEKLKQAKYAISDEELRPYFPAATVINGLFEITNRLFDVSIKTVEAEVYHPDVLFYQIEHNGEAIAQFYLDLYARENKRGGAWMDECRVRRNTSEGLQLPVAYLTCNFTPPVGDKPALLTHDEVVTLFHEFGHGIHHMLTQVSTAAVSGINGVAWDAVELPSQFLENWCWQPEGLAIISGHFETGETLPETLLNNLLAAKNFQSAMQMLRQIEFSLFDFRLHRQYTTGTNVQDSIDTVRKEVSVIIPPAFNRFQNGFSHIFAGGYAAGYYSYKWAEVLSSDAFSAFEEEGVFNTETGARFKQCILEKGGSEDAMTLFTAFRGRKPNTDALLRHSGICT